MTYSPENEKFKNRPAQFSRRRLIKLAGLSGAGAAISPGFLKPPPFWVQISHRTP